MHPLPPEEPAREIARRIVASMLDKTREVFSKYMTMKKRLKEEFGLEAIAVGELVECRKLLSIRLSQLNRADPNLQVLFHGTVVEKGIREVLELKKGDLCFRRVGNYVLFGSADAMLDLGDTSVPVEIKTSLSFTLPRYSHFIQCSLYAFLYDAPFGILIFISRKFRIYVVPRIDEDAVSRLINLWNSISPLFIEECTYCPLKRSGLCSGGDKDYSKRSWLYSLALSLRRASAEIVLERDVAESIAMELTSRKVQ